MPKQKSGQQQVFLLWHDKNSTRLAKLELESIEERRWGIKENKEKWWKSFFISSLYCVVCRCSGIFRCFSLEFLLSCELCYGVRTAIHLPLFLFLSIFIFVLIFFYVQPSLADPRRASNQKGNKFYLKADKSDFSNLAGWNLNMKSR